MAVCDIKPDRLDRAASLAARDQPQVYRTPGDLHVEMALAALQAGKQVYCEKPVGITPESINRVWRAGKASKQVWQTGLGMRSSERNRNLIGKIHGGIEESNPQFEGLLDAVRKLEQSARERRQGPTKVSESRAAAMHTLV